MFVCSKPKPAVAVVDASADIWVVPVCHCGLQVINTTYVTLSVSADKTVRSYNVSTVSSKQGGTTTTWSRMFDADGSGNTSNAQSLTVDGLAPGSVTVSVAAVDLAGNVDVTPRVLHIVVISTSPLVVVTAPPPRLTNASSVAMTVASPNELLGLLAGFIVIVRPVVGGAPVSLLVNGSDSQFPGTVALSQQVTVANLSSGAYAVDVWAIDVLGNAGDTVTASFTVDLQPPTSAFVTALPAYSDVTVSYPWCLTATALSQPTFHHRVSFVNDSTVWPRRTCRECSVQSRVVSGLE